MTATLAPPEPAAATTPASRATLGLPALTAMVVGSMVGAGVFQLPARFAGETGVVGALCAGNAFYWVLIMTTLSQLFPGLAPHLGQGDTWLAFALSAAAVWGFYALVVRGVQQAAAINAVVTVAKLVPLALFVVLAVTCFDAGVFAANLTGGYDLPGGDTLFAQVQGTMLVTVFVFLGIEGASVYSRYARRREDVGRATVLGFSSVLALFASISILAYGVLPRAEIAALPQPSIGGVLEAAVGPWGGTFIRVGLIVSVLGAYLAWQLLAADVLFAAAQDRDMPRVLARRNRHGVPRDAVLWTSVLVTAILFAVQFVDDALDFSLDLTAALALAPFALASAYAVKIAVRRDGYAGVPRRTRNAELAVALVSTAYTLFLLWAAGYVFWFLACLLLAPGTALYVRARRERGSVVLSRSARATFAAVVAMAAVGAVLLATGAVRI